MFIFLGDFQNPNSFTRNSGKMTSWRTFRIRSQKLSMSNTKCIIFKRWFGNNDHREVYKLDGGWRKRWMSERKGEKSMRLFLKLSRERNRVGIMRKGCNSELRLSTFVIVLDHSQMAGHCCQLYPSMHRMIVKVVQESSSRIFQNLSCKSNPEHHSTMEIFTYRSTPSLS